MLRPAIIALMFAQSLAHAQSTGKISGKVTDSLTHQPIPKVHVSCMSGVQFVGTLTGIDGSYALEDVQSGPIRMTVNLDGYKLITERSEKGAAFPIAAGDAVTRNFEMHPLGRIYGKLVDRDTGESIKGHMVSAVGKSYVPGHTFLIPRAGEQSGEEFNIRNLEPGDYVIQIDRQEAGTFVFSTDSTPAPPPQKCYGQRWYPDVPRIEMAVPIHLAEGETRKLDLSLQSRETHSVSGMIKAPREFESQPVTFVLRTSDVLGSVAVMPAPGPFRIDNLTPGTHRLGLTGGKAAPIARTPQDFADFMLFEAGNASAGKSHSEVVADYVFEIADHDLYDFKLTLAPYAGVSGEVRMLEEDARLPGGRLSVVLMPTADYLIELPGGGAIGGGPMMIASTAVQSGRFHQDSLHPSEYWPQLMGLPAGYAVAQVLFEGSTPRNTTMTLGAPDTPLTFVVTSRPGAIAGVVRDEGQSPVRGASVVLLPDPIPDKVAPSVIRVGESGEGGAFAFRDLAPGRYRAVVLDGSDHAHEGDVGFLRDQAARADGIEVRAGQLVSVNIKQ